VKTRKVKILKQKQKIDLRRRFVNVQMMSAHAEGKS
jgi:hypothetical protein